MYRSGNHMSTVVKRPPQLLKKWCFRPMAKDYQAKMAIWSSLLSKEIICKVRIGVYTIWSLLTKITEKHRIWIVDHPPVHLSLCYMCELVWILITLLQCPEHNIFKHKPAISWCLYPSSDHWLESNLLWFFSL